MRRLFSLFALGLSCAWVATPCVTAQTYSVTDLGFPPQTNYSQAQGINQSGQVIALAGTLIPGFDFGQVTAAFVYSDGTMTPLDFSPRGIAGDDRQKGDAAKLRITGISGESAVLYQDNFLRTLGTLPGDNNSIGYAVNNSGEVAGVSNPSVGAGKAFLYQGGNLINLGFFPGGAGAQALSINDLGDVTGEAFLANGDGHAFFYHNDQLTDLGTLPGSVSSVGESINNAGEVTGYTSAANSSPLRAFLWSHGNLHDLGILPQGTFSEGHGINGLGQVVGEADAPIPNFPGLTVYHGFVYRDGKMYDLNRLIPPNSGWVIEVATGINDKGEIAATGYAASGAGGPHALLLQPSVSCCTGSPVKLTVKDGQGFFWDGGGSEYGRTALQVYQDDPSKAQNWTWQPVPGGFTICTLSSVCLSDNGAQVALGKRADVFVITDTSAVLDTNTGRYIQNALKPVDGAYLSTGPVASAWSFSLVLH